MQPQALDLKDIHLPDTLGWWPPALGWWLLALSILLLILAIIWLVKRITRKTAIKSAKKMLFKIKLDTDLDDAEKLTQLSELIRRVAMSISPRNETASLTGISWLQYLDRSVDGNRFTQGAGNSLTNAHYQKKALANGDVLAVITICEDWLNAQKEAKK